MYVEVFGIEQVTVVFLRESKCAMCQESTFKHIYVHTYIHILG
jgi:hypothetical protein